MSVLRFLKPYEVTSLLGISYSTLLRKVKNGKIPFIKTGKFLRFPISYFNSLEDEAMENLRGEE